MNARGDILAAPLVIDSAAPVGARARPDFRLRSGSAELFARSTDVPAEIWAATFGDSPKDFAYYRLIEETMTSHFSYRYLLMRGSARVAVALQPLIIADQDLTASSGAIVRQIAKAFRRLAPRFLRTRMLMAGCLVGDGKLGVIAGADSLEAAALLGEGLLAVAKRERISLITVKDFPAEFREVLAPLTSTGYCRLPSFPPMKLELDFSTFDEYMQRRLGKITRKGLRRKLRKAGEAKPAIKLEVTDDCRDVIDEIYPLYLAVAGRSDVSFEIFTKEYFVEASRRMPERFRFFIWRQGGRAVAFSFCTIWRDAIYDNDIGLDYSVAHELNLYYVTFRDLLEWALAHGLRTYHSAPFNYDPKLHLRLQPEPVDIYVRHTSPILNAALGWVAPAFAPAKSDPALRRYRAS
ncbi:MAG: GNAT family N-acetyltransferase [Verrucomicrobiota bacterium]|nr:GNAT family N-acetyltransferase [Verrucomicrobiota bacterium]